MAKCYTDDLAAWVATRAKKKRQQDAAAVAFLAVRGDIGAAIGAGYALTTIWAHMHETGKVKCTYETFRKHVRRFMAASARRAGESATPTAGVKPRMAGKGVPPAMGGFTFDATPRKEDLI